MLELVPNNATYLNNNNLLNLDCKSGGGSWSQTSTIAHLDRMPRLEVKRLEYGFGELDAWCKTCEAESVEMGT